MPDSKDENQEIDQVQFNMALQITQKKAEHIMAWLKEHYPKDRFLIAQKSTLDLPDFKGATPLLVYSDNLDKTKDKAEILATLIHSLVSSVDDQDELSEILNKIFPSDD